MLERSETNKYIAYFGWFVLVGSIIAMAIVIFALDDSSRWLIGPGIFIAGAFNALLLFAISEVLSRLQDIAYNTERDNIEVKEKASS